MSRRGKVSTECSFSLSANVVTVLQCGWWKRKYTGADKVYKAPFEPCSQKKRTLIIRNETENFVHHTRNKAITAGKVKLVHYYDEKQVTFYFKRAVPLLLL